MSAAIDLGTIFASVTLDLGGLKAGVASAKAQMSGFSSQIAQHASKAGAAFNTLAKNGAAQQIGRDMAVAGVAITAALGGAVKSAADFDQALRNVDSIAHLSEKSFGQLHDSVIALAKDPNIRQGPADLAKGLYDVYSSGFTGKKALDILKVASYGASAGMSDTATSGKVLMAVLNSGIPGVKSASQAMDVLFQEVNLGVNTFGELANSLPEVLPTAKLLGVTLQDVAASFALMTRAGVNAAETGTAVNQMLGHILKPTSGAAQAMDALGISYGQNALKGKPLIDYLTTLIAKIKEYAATHKTLQVGNKDVKISGPGDVLANLFPDVRAFKASAITSDLKGSGIEKFGEMLKGMQGGAAGQTMEALTRQNKGAAAQMELLKKQFQLVAISAGEQLLPALRVVVDALSKLVSAFSNLPEPVKKFLVIGTAIAGVALTVVGGLVSLAASAVTLGAALAEAGVTVAGVGAALSAVAAPVAAVIAVVAALAIAWKTDFGHIREHTAAFVAWLKPYLLQAWNAVKSGTMQALGAVRTFVAQVWPDIKGIIQKVMSVLGPIVRAGWAVIVAFTKGDGAILLAVLKGIWDTFKAVVKTAWDVITGIVRIGLKLLNLDWAGAWKLFQSYAARIWVDIQGIIRAGLGGIISTISAFGSHLLSSGKALFGAFVSGIRSQAGTVKAAVASVIGPASLLLPHSDAKEGPLSTLTASGAAIPKTLAEGVHKGKHHLTAAMKEMARDAKEQADAIKKTLDDIFDREHDQYAIRRRDAGRRLSDDKAAGVPKAMRERLYHETVADISRDKAGDVAAKQKEARQTLDALTQAMGEAGREMSEQVRAAEDEKQAYLYKSQQESAAQYRAYLKERLGDFDEYSSAWIAIADKIAGVDSDITDQAEKMRAALAKAGEAGGLLADAEATPATRKKSKDGPTELSPLQEALKSLPEMAGNAVANMATHFKGLKDFFSTIAAGILNSFQQLIAQIVTRWATLQMFGGKGLGGAAGGASGGAGGLGGLLKGGGLFGGSLAQTLGWAGAGLAVNSMLGNPLGKIAKGIGKVFHFNSGGIVPGIGNRDTVPAMLTPGERVLTQDEVRNGSGGGRQIVINHYGDNHGVEGVERMHDNWAWQIEQQRPVVTPGGVR